MLKDRTIYIKNIYYMLSYVFTNINSNDISKIDNESFDNIHNLLANILFNGINKQIKRGLYKEYININEDLYTIKGKINLNNSINNKINNDIRINCDYDDLSINNIYNQILKVTLCILFKCDLERNIHSKLKKCLVYFSEVDSIDIKSINWNTIRFQRNNNSYKMLLIFCRFILDSMLLTTNKGEYKLNNFFDEKHLNKLYEKFILEYYKKHYSYLKPASIYINWATDNNDDTYLLPSMITDITLFTKDKVLIIDAKYYSHNTIVNQGKRTINSSNLYQIFSYVKNAKIKYSDKEIIGMLLYVKTDEEIQPDQTYNIDNNIIMCKNLDLNQDFSMITKYLDDIIEIN